MRKRRARALGEGRKSGAKRRLFLLAGVPLQIAGLLLGATFPPAAAAEKPRPVMCGKEVPPHWCGGRVALRPVAWAELKRLADGATLGGVTFFAQKERLDFAAYANSLPPGDYKVVLDLGGNCTKFDAAFLANRSRIAIHSDLNITTMYAELNGVADSTGSLQGLSVDQGPLPVRNTVALLVNGSDLTEAEISGNDVIACGHMQTP